MDMGKEFKTQDIKLAKYLKVNGSKFIRVEPLDRYNSTFIFEQPSQELLAKWFNDSAKTQMIIDTYRTLLRDARIIQNKCEV